MIYLLLRYNSKSLANDIGLIKLIRCLKSRSIALCTNINKNSDYDFAVCSLGYTGVNLKINAKVIQATKLRETYSNYNPRKLKKNNQVCMESTGPYNGRCMGNSGCTLFPNEHQRKSKMRLWNSQFWKK